MIDFFSEHWILALLLAAALGIFSSYLLKLWYAAKNRSAQERWQYEEQERIDEQKQRRP